MGRPKQRDPAEIAEIVRLYVDEGMPVLAVSLEVKRDQGFVRSILHEQGVEMRTQRGNYRNTRTMTDGIKGKPEPLGKLPRVKLGNSNRGHRRRGSL